MSRAFVKENDGDDFADDLPDRPVSSHPNYVTALGLSLLREQVRGLQALREALADSEDMADKQRLASVERDLRYYEDRANTAVLVDPATQADDRVHFGSTVEVRDAEGGIQRFAIVGEDEADVASGRISWVSPLADALMDAQVGDSVVWRRPAGDRELAVLSILKAAQE